MSKGILNWNCTLIFYNRSSIPKVLLRHVHWFLKNWLHKNLNVVSSGRFYLSLGGHIWNCWILQTWEFLYMVRKLSLKLTLRYFCWFPKYWWTCPWQDNKPAIVLIDKILVMSLVNVFVNRQSAFLWVLSLHLFLPTCSLFVWSILNGVAYKNEKKLVWSINFH